MKPVAWLRWVAAAMLVLGALSSPRALAQPRFYWKSLSDANAVPLIVNSISGNTNPFDPAHLVTPGANFSGTLAIAGYARTFSLFDRATMVAVIVPMGRVSGEVTGAGGSTVQSASGVGDPMVEFDINVLGPRAQKDLVQALRFEPGFSLDILADLAFPIGQYDNTQPLNLGQHRWYGRVGAPIVWQLGPWVPGQRTTLECVPVVWFFGPNNDYLEGKTLKTDPMLQLDAHLTRDFTTQFWGSLDATWYYGAGSSLDGVQLAKKLNNFGVGATLGYQITDNLGLTVGYKTTVGANAPEDVRMDSFMVTLVFGWHSLIEGVKRLESGK